MIKKEIKIQPHNRKAHYDIHHDILLKRDGLFTFVVRVNNGQITDYTYLEAVNYGKRYRVPTISRRT